MTDLNSTPEQENNTQMETQTVAAPKRKGRPQASTEKPVAAKAPAAQKAAGKAAPTKSTAAPKAAPKAAQTRGTAVEQNGIRQPISGVTSEIWNWLDAQRKALKRVPLIAELKATRNDLAEGTLSTQYAQWCKFHGITKEDRAKAREKAAK